ncbi:hypothetical protein L2E82_19653 [Cichorium intybus]|uniref:Uncharacterized protein n=1 Tax=Cichorium intybus TaxID=13427 RepID=A0ACB9FBS6_CICIN|nr:hypothetical protein L2E82_19653 [Cichorium intybus]
MVISEFCLLKAMGLPLPPTLLRQATHRHHNFHRQGDIRTLTRRHSLRFIKDTWLKTILRLHLRLSPLTTANVNMTTIKMTARLSSGAGWLPFASVASWRNVFEV